jgi:hypothetical protein
MSALLHALERTLRYLRHGDDSPAAVAAEFTEYWEAQMATNREHETRIGQGLDRLEGAAQAAAGRLAAEAEEIKAILRDLEAKLDAANVDRIDSADEVARLDAVSQRLDTFGVAPTEPTGPEGEPV